MQKAPVNYIWHHFLGKCKLGHPVRYYTTQKQNALSFRYLSRFYFFIYASHVMGVSPDVNKTDK